MDRSPRPPATSTRIVPALLAVVFVAFNLAIPGSPLQPLPAAAATTALTVNVGTPTGTYAVGETLTYPVTVTNPGTDSVTNLSAVSSLGNTVTCTSTTVAPAASISCTTNHVLTAADLAAGDLTNTITANGQAHTCTPNTLTRGSSSQSSYTFPSGETGVQHTWPLNDASGTKVADLYLRYEQSLQALSDANPAHIDIYLFAPTGTEPTVPLEVAIEPVANGLVGAGTIVLDGVSPLFGGTYYNNYSGLTVSSSGPVTGITLLAEDTPSEISNADAGDTLVPGTTYDVTDSRLYAAEAPAFRVEYAFNQLTEATPISMGAEFYYPTAQNRESHRFTTGFTGCTMTTSPVSGSDSDTTNLWEPSMTVTKALSSGTLEAGQTITYKVTVENTGNVALSGIVIDDPLTPDESCPLTSIAPGASIDCSATYTLTQADVDSGGISNTASVTSTLPDGNAGPAESDTLNTAITAAPALTVTKSTNPGTVVAGSNLNYTFVVANTGNVTVDNISIDDPLTPDESCPGTSLAAGESMNCTGTHVVTAAEASAGTVINTATATGTAPDGAPVSGSGTSNLPFPVVRELTTEKVANWVDADADGFVDPGETINYAITVTNSGSVVIYNIGVADALTGPPSCDKTELWPGDAANCTASYVVTEADIIAGSIDNEATATGNDASDGTGAMVDSSDSTSTATTVKTGLSVVKSATVTPVAAGDVINYSIDVTNTGNLTLDPITIDDALTTDESCPATTLAPDTVMTCTASYTVTQDDVDAGEIPNTVTVEGTDALGNAPSEEANFLYPIPHNPQMTVTKDGTASDLDGDGEPEAGDTISYSIVVKNTGNVTLTDFSIVDPLTTDESCPVTELAPGAELICTATYLLTQANIDTGTVDNTATVTATEPNGTNVVAAGSNTQSVPGTASLDVTKSGTHNDTDGDGMAEVGETIDYTITVTNTGSRTLSSLSVTDTLTGPPTCDATTLAPDDIATCTVTYTLTQSDVDNGGVDNTATATATDPHGTQVSEDGAANTALTANPAITVNKTTDAVNPDVGTTIDYVIEVTNTGNVTLTDIAATDPLTPTPTCDTTTLAPGEVATCLAIYVVTQADIDSGAINNIATVTAKDPAGGTTSQIGSDTLPFTANPHITVIKDGVLVDTDGDGRIEAGETVNYTITVTNSGNVTKTNLTIADPLTSTPVCDVTTLAPGEDATCTATHTLTQAEIDLGMMANTATATVTDPSGGSLSRSATSNDPLAAQPAMTVTKTTDATEPAVGDTVTYTIKVTNTGNVTLSGLSIADPRTPAPTCDTTTLAPNAVATCTVNYTTTQADVDNGSIDNTATATATDPHGTSLEESGSNSIVITRSAAIETTKAGVPVDSDNDGQIEAGETITYTITVTNTGNVTLTNLLVADPTAGAPTCDTTDLAPGAKATCTVSYTLTQADVDNGSIDNTATATATDPTNASLDDSGTTTTAIASSPALGVTKTTDAVDPAVGDTINYTIKVTNTGNVTLTSLTVADTLTGPPTCDTTTLAPGAVATCTANYVVTQADVDSGTIDNTATATAADPFGGSLSKSGTNDLALTANPQFTVAKNGVNVDTDSDGQIEAGETIDYSITVTNTGNVTLSSLSIADTLTGPPTCDVTTLAPADVATCTVTYTLTQRNIDNGTLENTATATATDPSDGSLNKDGTTENAFVANPKLSVTKTADATEPAVGDTINYTITVANTGNVTLTNISVADPLTSDESCPNTSLAPGATMDCTASYVVTQADADNGRIENIATASATDPFGDPVSQDAGDTVTITPAPDLSVTKTGVPVDTDSDGQIEAGETVDYTITVTNTGNVTLSSLTVADTLTGPPTCDVTTLAPADVATCTVTYTLTQRNIDNGTLENTATATATDPSGSPLNKDATTTNPLAANPTLTVTKTADATEPAVGDTINYTIRVTNTGNVTLGDISVTDPLTTDESCPDTSLAPGAQMLCTASYVVTQADVDSGSIDNSATATATAPAGTTTGETGTNTVGFTANPHLTVTKTGVTVDTDSDGQIEAGETIDYTITVTNSGNVTLSGLSVGDPITEAPTCDVTTLAPTDVANCTVTYTLAQDDVDRGFVPNTATAVASSPSGDPLSGSATSKNTLEANPALTVTKSAPSDDLVVGETVHYTIVVSNSGNVTVDDISVADPLTGDETCPDTSLAPGTQTTCTASYVITQADVDNGTVDNTATATATDPNGTAVTASGSNTLPFAADPSLEVDKVGRVLDTDDDGLFEAGETIEYTITVTNDGNVTVTNIEVDDPLTGTPTCDRTDLAPGQFATCTASYTVTQDDVDNGTVSNTASASGLDPSDASVTATGSTVTAAPASAELTVHKTANGNLLVAGGVITYEMTVTNTGNVTVTDIVIDDPLTADESCPADSLAPGASMSCTASYVIADEDVAVGLVVNTATATGTDPSGAAVSASGEATFPQTAEPQLAVVKTGVAIDGDEDGMIESGDVVSFTIIVTNTGNIRIDDISIDDPLTGDESCPADSLTIGAEMVCTASYVVTQNDIAAGAVDNTATVSGIDPTGAAVTNAGSTTVAIDRVADLEVVKTAAGVDTNGDGILTTDEAVLFTIVVTNTGNVRIDDLAVSDPLTDPPTCDTDSLAPGQSATCTVTYSISSADVLAGNIVNTASATGTGFATQVGATGSVTANLADLVQPPPSEVGPDTTTSSPIRLAFTGTSLLLMLSLAGACLGIGAILLAARSQHARSE